MTPRLQSAIGRGRTLRQTVATDAGARGGSQIVAWSRHARFQGTAGAFDARQSTGCDINWCRLFGSHFLVWSCRTWAVKSRSLDDDMASKIVLDHQRRHELRFLAT